VNGYTNDDRNPIDQGGFVHRHSDFIRPWVLRHSAVRRPVVVFLGDACGGRSARLSNDDGPTSIARARYG